MATHVSIKLARESAALVSTVLAAATAVTTVGGEYLGLSLDASFNLANRQGGRGSSMIQNFDSERSVGSSLLGIVQEPALQHFCPVQGS